MDKKAKILLYDLEVSRSIVEGYGNKWDFKVVKVIRPQLLMCFSYKWLGEKNPTWVSMHDFDKTEDFVSFLRDLFDEADIVIAHNANKFDNKMSNRYFIKYDVDPPSPYFTVDTLSVARSRFKFESNSLNDLGEYLGVGSKEDITYADLETDFMGSPTAATVNLMRKYNNTDVNLLEKIYLKLRPYITNHPNVARISNIPDSCPKCGIQGRMTRQGYKYTTVGKKQQYKCKACRGWFTARKPVKEDDGTKPNFVNSNN